MNRRKGDKIICYAVECTQTVTSEARGDRLIALLWQVVTSSTLSVTQERCAATAGVGVGKADTAGPCSVLRYGEWDT